jgi:hypothetical protein
MENKTRSDITLNIKWTSLLVLCAALIGFNACDNLNIDDAPGEGTINFYLSNTSVDGEKSADIDGSAETGELSENNHNRPQNLEEVNVDVQQISIFYQEARVDTVSADSVVFSEGGKGEWLDVPLEPGILNLLDIPDTDILLTSVDLPEGYYSEVRLILGDDNTVVTEDGDVHDLMVPSGGQSGYKIKFDSQLYSGQSIDLTIEFDAEQSIHITGNGRYMLNPVLNLRGGN